MILRVFLFLSLLSVPLSSSALTCEVLFRSKPTQVPVTHFDDHLKELVLKDALLKSNLTLTSDKEYIRKVLNKWNLRESTPVKIEAVAQALVLKLDQKRSFLKWLKSIAVKKDGVREAVRVRAQTLLLKRELIDGLETRGLLRKNTSYDRYKEFRQEHFNKIQLAKLIVLNSVTIYYLNVPLYFPNFDWVKNLDLKSDDLDLVQEKGFASSYKTILDKYRYQLRGQLAMEHVPQAFFLSVAIYTAYNYLKFEPAEINEGAVVETVPESHVLFKEWQKDFEERNGARPDMSNAQVRKEWDTTVLSVYGAWADIFSEKEGRRPDLSNPADRREWEKFLSRLEQ